MSEANKITVDELRYRRLKERLANMISEYEAKLVEAGIERDVLQANHTKERNELIQRHSEELNRLNQRVQELEDNTRVQEERHEVVNGEVL